MTLWRCWWSPLYKRSLHDLVQVLRRSCWDPGKVLSTRPLRQDLADDFWFEVLGSLGLRGPGMTFGPGLLQFLVRKPFRDPGKSSKCPCMISYRVLGRKKGGDPVEIPCEVLALGSWRCFALVLVWRSFWDVHKKFLYEDLLRSFIKKVSQTSAIFWNSLKCPGMRFWYEVLMSRCSLAPCAKTSSCCRSYDNV